MAAETSENFGPERRLFFFFFPEETSEQRSYIDSARERFVTGRSGYPCQITCWPKILQECGMRKMGVGIAAVLTQSQINSPVPALGLLVGVCWSF